MLDDLFKDAVQKKKDKVEADKKKKEDKKDADGDATMKD